MNFDQFCYFLSEASIWCCFSSFGEVCLRQGRCFGRKVLLLNGQRTTEEAGVNYLKDAKAWREPA